MSIAHLLEDFGGAHRDAAEPGGEAFETHRLAAFEEGYRAGWDDAAKARSDETAHLRSDLARCLQEMSFTYQEAHAQVARNLAPLFDRIAGSLLPETARATLGPHVVEQLTTLARDGADGMAEVVVAPESETAVAGLIEDTLPFPVRLRTDPMLGAGQVEIGIGSTEREIDLDAAVDAVGDAIRAYFQEPEPETRHG